MNKANFIGDLRFLVCHVKSLKMTTPVQTRGELSKLKANNLKNICQRTRITGQAIVPETKETDG